MPKKHKVKEKKVNIKKEFIFLCTSCAVIVLLAIAGFNIESFLNGDKVLGAQTETTNSSESQERVFWENFLVQNPRYLDGWLELAKIYTKEGNAEGAKNAIKKAVEINPNSENLKALQENLAQ